MLNWLNQNNKQWDEIHMKEFKYPKTSSLWYIKDVFCKQAIIEEKQFYHS